MRYHPFVIRALTKGFLGLAAIFVVGAGIIAIPPHVPTLAFPNEKRFAFTIVDDTDVATLDNVRPVYEFLEAEGIPVTKTVWVLPGTEQEVPANHGDSLSDPDYLDFVKSLQGKGFEVASHGARGGTSDRPEILGAMDQYKSELGAYPRIHVNHAANRDNLYWGPSRLTFPPYRWLYSLVRAGSFDGHDAGSPRFWGDFVHDHVDYVVDFSFFEINLWKLNPAIPYRVDQKPHVRTWFNTSDGGTLASFNELLASKNLDRLEAEGGVSIVYTHFGKGFYTEGRLDPEFVLRMKDLGSRPGWFAPASELLDFLREQRNGDVEISWRERIRLESIWLIEKLRYGPS